MPAIFSARLNPSGLGFGRDLGILQTLIFWWFNGRNRGRERERVRGEMKARCASTSRPSPSFDFISTHADSIEFVQGRGIVVAEWLESKFHPEHMDAGWTEQLRASDWIPIARWSPLLHVVSAFGNEVPLMRGPWRGVIKITCGKTFVCCLCLQCPCGACGTVMKDAKVKLLGCGNLQAVHVAGRDFFFSELTVAFAQAFLDN